MRKHAGNIHHSRCSQHVSSMFFLRDTVSTFFQFTAMLSRCCLRKYRKMPPVRWCGRLSLFACPIWRFELRNPCFNSNQMFTNPVISSTTTHRAHPRRLIALLCKPELRVYTKPIRPPDSSTSTDHQCDARPSIVKALVFETASKPHGRSALMSCGSRWLM